MPCFKELMFIDLLLPWKFATIFPVRLKIVIILFVPGSSYGISILIISFGSSFSQGVRASALIQRAVDKLKDEYIFYDNIYLRDITDTLFHPSLNRVAPLAQALQGKNQFYPELKHYH